MKNGKREPTDSGSEKASLATRPWYKNSMAILALISALVAAVSGLIALIQRLEPAPPIVMDSGFESRQSGNRSGKWQLTAGIRIVETDEEDTPDNGDYKASVPAGEEMTQPDVKIPTAASEMSVWYRSQNESSHGTLQVDFDDDNVYRQGVAAELEWEQATFPINHEKYGGRIVTLTVEYVASMGHTGGLLLIAAQPDANAIWVDNVQISEIEAETVAQVTDAPSATPTLTPSHTPVPRQPTSAPGDTPASSPEATEAQPTRTPSRTIAAAAVVTEPLSFTWSLGDFRQSGTNEQGIGIWAQEIFVDPSGGTPPYIILFDGQVRAETFEIFGLFCEGQIGVVTVRSTDGQEARENITVTDPICPTKTPTPTATPTPSPTRTITVTPANTPTPTDTPTPTEVPLPGLPLADRSGLFTIEGVQIQGQGRQAHAAPGSPVTVSVDYFIQDVGCPGCIDQILVGIADDATLNEPKGCVYYGVPGSAGVQGSGSLTFNVPNTPGVYYVRVHYGQAYSCDLGWWGVNGVSGPESSIGAIIVP